MAFHQHVQWGPGVDFTYGPLGFLMEPALYYAGTAALGATYLLLFRWFLFVLLLHVARPKFLGYWAVLVAYIVGAFVIVLVDPADALMACPLLVAVLAMRSGSERVMARAAFALGGLAAAGLLVKFSVGLLAVSIALVTAASAKRWWRSVLSVLATFLVTLMALWVATGNSLGNLPLYLRTAASIAGGFAGAMSGEQVGRYEYWYYAAIVTALLTVSLALGLRAASRRANICA